jgi:hypothetical protein
LAIHGSAQYAIDARLVTAALAFEPIQYVRIKTDAELFLGRRPRRPRPRKETLGERRYVRIVNLGIGHTVNPRQVACD